LTETQENNNPVHGQPLPSGHEVLRVASALSKDFHENRRAHVSWFNLSSSDKLQNPPRLSVFDTLFTTPVEAWIISGSKEGRRAVALLPVDGIRKLRPIPDNGDPSLDVISDREEIDECMPGHIGHAGILGLDSQSRKSYRVQLAEMATVAMIE